MGGLRLETEISLRDVPKESRARTVAVAVSELYRVAEAGESGPPPTGYVPSESQRAPGSMAPQEGAPIVPEPKDEAKAPPASSEESSPASEGEPKQRPMFYEAHASVQGLAMETPAFLGGGLGLRYQLSLRVWARASVDAHSSSTRTALGRVSLGAVSGSLGVDYVVDDQPRLTFGPSIQPLWVLARATSDATGLSENHSDSTLSMGARFGLEGRLVDDVYLSFSIELGAFAKEAVFRAGGRDAITFSGFTGGGLVGFVFQP